MEDKILNEIDTTEEEGVGEKEEEKVASLDVVYTQWVRKGMA
jgi:hypothetical protein